MRFKNLILSLGLIFIQYSSTPVLQYSCNMLPTCLTNYTLASTTKILISELLPSQIRIDYLGLVGDLLHCPFCNQLAFGQDGYLVTKRADGGHFMADD